MLTQLDGADSGPSRIEARDAACCRSSASVSARRRCATLVPLSRLEGLPCSSASEYSTTTEASLLALAPRARAPAGPGRRPVLVRPLQGASAGGSGIGPTSVPSGGSYNGGGGTAGGYSSVSASGCSIGGGTSGSPCAGSGSGSGSPSAGSSSDIGGRGGRGRGTGRHIGLCEHLRLLLLALLPLPQPLLSPVLPRLRQRLRQPLRCVAYGSVRGVRVGRGPRLPGGIGARASSSGHCGIRDVPSRSRLIAAVHVFSARLINAPVSEQVVGAVEGGETRPHAAIAEYPDF